MLSLQQMRPLPASSDWSSREAHPNTLSSSGAA